MGNAEARGWPLDEKECFENVLRMLNEAKDLIDVEVIICWVESQGQNLKIKGTGQPFKPTHYFIGPVPGGFTVWCQRQGGGAVAIKNNELADSLLLTNKQ